MRTAISIAAALFLSATVSAAAADGQYDAQLRSMLTQTAAGTCPAELMGDQLLAACRDQLPGMKAMFAAFGAVTGATFVSAEGEGSDRVETYTVRFAKGATATWHIGKFRDGKFQTAYSNG